MLSKLPDERSTSSLLTNKGRMVFLQQSQALLSYDFRRWRLKDDRECSLRFASTEKMNQPTTLGFQATSINY